ncbi:MAG: hypothetical protein ACREC6_10885 [Hyphomicrobiaceae bacterium]
MDLDLRVFAGGLAASLAAGALPSVGPAAAAPAYRGPNVIVVRFGGGVRRAETIAPKHTYAPYMCNVLAARGVLVRDMTIAQIKGMPTSHAEGTLNLLTGRYRAYRKFARHGIVPLYEPTQPTLFELLHAAFDLAPHEAVLVNGEDRPQEEFLGQGANKHYGVRYRCEVLSLTRFKLYKLQRALAEGTLSGTDVEKTRRKLEELAQHDLRHGAHGQVPALARFWERWQDRYGSSGLKHPRGDRLLTELALWALKDLRPKLMMINYQDPDYVHWGNASHYTRAIGIIDQGLEQLVAAVDADPAYRDRTVFAIVPDCGRDSNPLMSVPFQHHYNTRSAHEIWALVFGPGISRGKVVAKPTDQTSIAPTVGAIMGFKTPVAEGRVLDEISA